MADLLSPRADPTAERTLTTENVVASTDLELELDVGALAVGLEPAEYDPETLPGLVYRLEDCVCLVFRSGKLVATGAQTVATSREAIRTLVDDLRALGVPAPATPEITIHNLVACGSLDQSLDLSAVAVGLGLATVEYEPAQHPGLGYRLDDPDVFVSLFANGSCVVTGATEPNEAEAAFETVRDRLAELGLVD